MPSIFVDGKIRRAPMELISVTQSTGHHIDIIVSLHLDTSNADVDGLIREIL